MFTGAMQVSKSLFLFLFIPFLVIVSIVGMINGELITNLLFYGKISGPCVWPVDYVMMGGSMDELTYDEKNECYLKNNRDI